MKKLLFFLTIAAGFISIATMTPMNIVSSPTVQEKQNPPYAKWGLLAMEKTMEKYPNARITDYLHIGRIVGKETSTEQFKLILKENEREFGLFVDLEFKNDTEQLVEIRFKETTP